MKLSTLGIDLAKTVFQVHGVDEQGRVVVRRRLSRNKLLTFIAQLEPCLIGLEACGSAHYWAREMSKFGHDVRLMSPQFVKPYVKSNKHDVADAEAICEAVGRPNMRFVPVKGIEQQDIQSLHRARELLIKQRTALSNQIRGLLGEYGLVVAKGVHRLRRSLPELLEDAENTLSFQSREIFYELYQQLIWLDERIGVFDKKIEQVFRSNEACQRLGQMEGIGPLTATALYAALHQAKEFKNGRQMSAWLGLVPRQHSTGGKPLLLGISKRGDRYLRTLLIHGARAVIFRVKEKETRRAHWLRQLIARRGVNRAAVALANKMARMAWVILNKGASYQPNI
jgi:transposase